MILIPCPKCTWFPACKWIVAKKITSKVLTNVVVATSNIRLGLILALAGEKIFLAIKIIYFGTK